MLTNLFEKLNVVSSTKQMLKGREDKEDRQTEKKDRQRAGLICPTFCVVNISH